MTTHASRGDRVDAAGQVRRWVDEVVGRGYHRYCPTDSWTPSVNLYEGDDSYCIVVELSGMTSEGIDLRVEKGVLIISGERITPPPADGKRPLRVHLMEIDHGRFCRGIEVPEGVASDAIEASYKHGYLFIRLPRK